MKLNLASLAGLIVVGAAATYAASPVSGSAQGEPARSFAQFLGSPAGRAIFAANGIE